MARRPARLREPARRQRRALRALSAQEERLQRDGRRAPAGASASASSQDYIDAQNGGPGKGWFRIVTTRSRRAASSTRASSRWSSASRSPSSSTAASTTTQPECDDGADRPPARRGLRARRARHGARQQVRQRARAASPATRARPASSSTPATSYETGKFWEMQTCRRPRPRRTTASSRRRPASARDALVGNGLAGLRCRPGTAPVYAAPPHCNTRGLTRARRAPRPPDDREGDDHRPRPPERAARASSCSTLVEAARYSGVVSSHSWSTPDAFPRIYKLGGVVTPYAGGSTGFVEEWHETKPMRDPRFYFGFGYGADMNGFGSQGGPRGRARNPVDLPVQVLRRRGDARPAAQRRARLRHQRRRRRPLRPVSRTGSRTCASIAGDEIVERHGARRRGLPADVGARRGHPDRLPPGPRAAHPRGLGGVRLGARHDALLRRAGQPRRAGARLALLRGIEAAG